MPKTEAPKSGIFVILLGDWFVFIFWENQTAADQGSLSAMSARFRAKFVVCHLCQALRPREQLLLLGLALSCFTVPPSFFFLTSSSRTLLCCALCFPVSHYKVFLEQVAYINFKIERRLVRQKTRRRKCERKLDWKDEETREIRGNLKRPKSPKLGKTPLSTEVCGTSSLRCMWVRCITKGICKCGEKKAASLIKMVKSVRLGLC